MFTQLLGCCRRRSWDALPVYADVEDDELAAEIAASGLSFARTIPRHPGANAAVHLDLSSAGQFAVILKNKTRICGSGAARGNTAIMQNKAFFEVKVQTTGDWAVGLCLDKANMMTFTELKKQSSIWILLNDGSFWHNCTKEAELVTPIEEGDVLGFYYDHAELRVVVNGIPSKIRICSTETDPSESCESRQPPSAPLFQTGLTGIRGTVFPLVATDGGAILDTLFSSFYFPPPPESGYTQIQHEKDIL